ncbi:hypothetical protein BZY95_00320 [Billgrantia desiderata SP1]|uniref:DUF1365 domain-containing protein n=1 Tax=Billgrantia desiderata TaxID=52021 RepID=A0ABS9B927_9GAMM|nr:DUF1365 domain-containing protein [Halomonas desiderata]MCE8043875.1 DUF1365 domain-containing protein [Halomonas desiderata]MCE8048402.1 DUF1365 domain-containing protein [Halomonas desiderata]OUE47195.1 hypothetical protein BZY95_00320 [Halomonas desiderata SP1]
MTAHPRSRVCHGRLQHRRHLPRRHRFEYAVWMMWLDLDELPELFDGVPGFSARRPALARFRREDYLTPFAPPLAEVARAEVCRQLGQAPQGRVCLLTQLRTLGSGFNPISLYYLYHREVEGGALGAVLGEVTNTPWRERTRYACAVEPGRHAHAAEFTKSLHVSPFMPLDMTYRWRFDTPGETLALHMETWRQGERHFDASLTLTMRPATRSALLAALARQPWMNLKTLAAIHYEALRLWAKGVPVHDHPQRKETTP